MKTNSQPAFSPRLQSLLAASDGLPAKALKEAQAALAEKQAEEAKARALSVLTQADTLLVRRVERLRAIRQEEKLALENVHAADSAIKEFLKDGNLEELNKKGNFSIVA